ncbi:Uncharacterised protein [Neisseria animalis]|nr:Uncharacterised protein [Neisseria animalis]
MIQRCFALPYYVYCLRLRCLVSFLFYSTIQKRKCEKAVCIFDLQTAFVRQITAEVDYSTVTDLAKLRGLSTSVPRANAAW